MAGPAYKYNKKYSHQYVFTSKGIKGEVIKVIEFTPTSIHALVNLGFGDLNDDGTVNDRSITNNQDIKKILTTVVAILQDYLDQNNVRVIFTGSTDTRTRLYERILRLNRKIFSEKYRITALVETHVGIEEVIYESDKLKYLAFIIEKKK